MNIRFLGALWIGKLTAFAVNMIDKQRETNFSGKVATKFMPNFVAGFKKINLDNVIFVTGTNGKSATTNLIAHTFKSAGKKIATNTEGANMMGGVATTLIKNSSFTGKFKKEFLILEIDERSLSAIHKVLPAHNLCITNLQKDQVQRNGDPDFISSKFANVINKNMTLFVNNEEPRSRALEDKAGQVVYFSVERNQKSFEKDNFYDVTLPCPKCNHAIKYNYFNLESIGNFECTYCNYKSVYEPQVLIKDVDFENNTFSYNKKQYTITYHTPFYIYNYAVTIAVAQKFGLTEEQISQAFKTFVNPGERREVLQYKDKTIHYLRMKQENPETLQSALDTIAADKTEKAIFAGFYEVKDFLPYYSNTFYFFDCDFKKIVETPVEKYIVFSKTVCYDVANRMIYDGANQEKIEIIDNENVDTILKKMDELKTKNIYILTGMKPYPKVKKFLEKEAFING